MTKTEYREYIAGEDWRRRRREYLEHHDACNRCTLPREICAAIYDEDIHVHHKSYARVGAELDSDLEALCKRCHEIETFGSSNLIEKCWNCLANPVDGQMVCLECRPGVQRLCDAFLRGYLRFCNYGGPFFKTMGRELLAVLNQLFDAKNKERGR